MTRHRDGRPDEATRRRQRMARVHLGPRLGEVFTWAALAALVYTWVGPAGAIGVAGLAVVLALAGVRIVGWWR
jgi:hypothetical protein